MKPKIILGADNTTTKVTVAFDVDDTLIRQDKDGRDIPRYDVIQLFSLLEMYGCEMYIWSGGGINYAKVWAEKLGLKAKIVEKFSFEPDIIVDDGYEMGTKNCAIIKV